MKTIQFIIIGLLVGTRLFSQDTLFTREGHMIAGKVIEINNEDIKYKKSSNIDGPVYVISKSEIVLIEYKNGTKDVFGKTDISSNNSNQTNSNNNQNYSNYPSQVYVNPRPSVNVVVGPSPFFNFFSWGPRWNRGWVYRPHVNYGGGFHGGYGHHR